MKVVQSDLSAIVCLYTSETDFNYFFNNTKLSRDKLKSLHHSKILELIGEGGLIKMIPVDPITPNTGEIFKLKKEKCNEVI